MNKLGYQISAQNSRDLSFSSEARAENLRRIGEMTDIFPETWGNQGCQGYET